MIVSTLGWALMHSLWRGALIAILVLSVVLATHSARVRYVAGLAGMSTLLLGFCLTLSVLLQHPVAAHSQGPLQVLAARIGLHRSVQLSESAVTRTPLVIGALRPIILTPAGMLAGLPADQVDSSEMRVPQGILLVVIESARVRQAIIEAANQYVGTLDSESSAVPEIQVRLRRDSRLFASAAAGSVLC